jgi:orotidine-5'-phosphate decarboxylase
LLLDLPVSSHSAVKLIQIGGPEHRVVVEKERKRVQDCLNIFLNDQIYSPVFSDFKRHDMPKIKE